MGNPLKAINKIANIVERKKRLDQVLHKVLPRSVNGFVMIDGKPVNAKRIWDWVNDFPKQSEIYGSGPKSLGVQKVLPYEPNKYIKFLGKDGLEFLDDVQGQIPRTYGRKLSVPHKMTNTVKDYLQTVNRKKIRKAGLSEKAIDEQINNLHDTTFIVGPDQPKIDGRSILDANTVHFNTLSDANQYETGFHEITHSFKNNAPSKTAEIKNHLDKNKVYDSQNNLNSNKQIKEYNSKILAPIIERNRKLINYAKAQGLVDDEYLDYFFSPEEMRAKMAPIQINAYKQGWTPKQAAKYTKGTYNTNLLHHLFDNDSFAELIDKIILKNEGKLYTKRTT